MNRLREHLPVSDTIATQLSGKDLPGFAAMISHETR